jgi:hypothetical protein
VKSATFHIQNRYLQAEKPTHSQAHFIFFVPQKIKRACLFPPLNPKNNPNKILEIQNVFINLDNICLKQF